MIRPSISIYASSGGTIFMDGARAMGVVFSTGEHGSEQMQAVIPMTSKEAIRMIDRIGTPDIWMSAFGETIWRGRLEDAEVTDDGLGITAYGYWRNLSDVPYTAMWSNSGVDGWLLVNSTQVANRVPDAYDADSNNRLYLALKKDAVYGTGTYVGEWGYEIPSGSSRQIVSISFDWSARLPTNWYARVDRYTSALSYQSTITTFLNPDDDTLSTGSVSQTFTGCDRVHIAIYYGGGGTYTYTGEAGDRFISITNLRVKTTTSSSFPDEIVADMIASAAQLDTSTALIDVSNTIDLTNETYEDQYPADILTRLAGLGDVSGNRWEVGVDNQKRLYYRPVGTNAREWFLNSESIQLQRSLSNLRNSVYAVYKDANGRAVRGTTSTNSTSTGRYGVTRRMALDVDTTSSTQANYYRDVTLKDLKDLTPKAAFKVRSIYGKGTAPLPPFLVRAGDYVTVNNLPPSADNALNKARRFRITRTEYDCDSGELTIEPEAPLPTLDAIIARREAIYTPPRAMDRIRRM